MLLVAVTNADYFENETMTLDLQRLEDAGWQLCVLQTGTPPSRQTFALRTTYWR